MEMENKTVLNTLEEKLLKTTWVKEAELLLEFVPNEDLTKTQIRALEKCIEKEELTENQIVELKKVLQKYRYALQKIRPEETVENYEEVAQMITTEQEFINLMQADEQRKLPVQINVNGKLIRFTFDILPLNDSRVVDALELNIDLFRDFSVDDINTYNKFARNEEITEEESKIIQRMNDKIMEQQSSKRISAMNNFLASQLKLENSETSFEERVEFWKAFPFNARASVFFRVQQMLGLTEDSNTELFPTG